MKSQKKCGAVDEPKEDVMIEKTVVVSMMERQRKDLLQFLYRLQVSMTARFTLLPEIRESMLRALWV